MLLVRFGELQGLVVSGQGGSDEATKTRLGGSFLLASELTIAEMAFINTLRPDVDFPVASLSTEYLENV